MSVLDGPGEGTWSVFAQKVVEQRDKAIEERNDVFRRLREAERRCVSLERERDEALRLLATRVEAKRLDDAITERDEARAKLRVTTTEYKPGWVQGLEAVARSAGYDPDKARHEGVEPPDFIQDVIDALRAEVAQLKRDAAKRSVLNDPRPS
jgi:hypothetical protein